MTQVRITPGTCYGRTHTETPVFRFYNVFLGNWLPEARPAGARIELGLGREQCRVTADAAIDSLLMQIPVGAGVGHLGIGPASDVESICRKLLPPRRVALDDFWHSDRTRRDAGRRKLGDLHHRSRSARHRGGSRRS